MVKASGQIEQELRTLQDKTEVMESALEPLYEGYLKALSEAGQRQLVMAAYYLCTQAYPDRFLALSWDDRNRLQQSLQVLAAQILEQLTQQRAAAKKMSRRPHRASDGLAFLQRLLETRMAGAAARKADGNAAGDERSPQPARATAELFSAEEEDCIPRAEEDLDAAADLDEQDFERGASEGSVSDNSALDNSALDNSALDNSALGESTLGGIDEDAKAAELAALGNADGLDGLDGDRNRAEDDMAFEMEVPAADERLSIDEEEDLLAALEGLARRSMEMRGDMRVSASSMGDGEAALEGIDEDDAEQSLTPLHLVKQQMLIERAIREVFKAVSEEANDLLQKANVMPSFPRSLLAAAIDSGEIGEPANAVPNVVKVSVRVMHGEALLEARDADDKDADDPDVDDREDDAGVDEGSDIGEARDRRPDERPRRTDSGRSRSERSAKERTRQDGRFRRSPREKDLRDSTRQRPRPSSKGMRQGNDRRAPRMMPKDIVEIEALPELAAISLRLSEVEFTDPTVSAWRSRLRQQLGELKTLGMRYKKTQRSLETAQAEDAWRSSWTVHNPEANS